MLLFSCKQEEIIDLNTETTDLTLDISQYDNANLGLYKGTFTTNDGSERGLVEIKILDNVPSRATIILSSGATIALQSTVNTISGQDIANLNFVTVADLKSPLKFSFSVSADGSGVAITNATYGSLDSDIMIAKETSRGPVTGITGTYFCTACGTQPTLVMGVKTFNLMYVGAASGMDTMTTQISLGGTTWTSTAAENSQGACVPNATAGFTDCTINGTTMVTTGGPLITWTGTHIYDTSATNCSSVSGSWTYLSPVYGSLAGTFASTVKCLPAATVGDLRAGGVVFWVDPADNTHGLVCALSDYPSLEQWGCNGTDLLSVPNVTSGPTGPGTEIGDGITNTNGILNVTDCPTAPAALAARSYGPEWFLPSAKELNEIHLNKAIINATATANGGANLSNNYYWSSTEFSELGAWRQLFNDGSQGIINKTSETYVRAVRAF